MAASPILGVAERYVYRAAFSFFVKQVRRFSLGAVLYLVTLPVFPVLNYFAFLFLAGTEPHGARQVYAAEWSAFWWGFWVTLPLYAVFSGALCRLGVPGAIRALRLAEPVLTRSLAEAEPETLRELLRQLAKVPTGLARVASLIYIAQALYIYSQSYLQRADLARIGLFALIDVFVVVMLAGLVYTLAEFGCSYLRVQVKRQLSALDEASNDLISGRSGVLRFFYLGFVAATSIVALVAFLYAKSDNVLSEAIQFAAITFLICGTLAFIYFFTWTYSLRQVSEATYAVAMGGRGHLPMMSNDRELVEVAVNFDAATYEINTIRNYLTELVDEKTRTLSEAYNELKALKSRQDGDYYLTSNLIESLTELRPESETVVLDSLIKQYKTFEFMGNTKEIGGDMNAGYALRLQGEKYTLVVNADAMGKSLQGAGGVLVLGSAIRSLIERTNITEGLRNLSPERWLKNSFLELHRLFSSFNGSMMASMVCLLVHDKSGYTVMINAEHPKGIRLRGAQAEFISNHEGLRKLGNNAVKGRLWVDTFVLRSGDVVILGSDGRDDLVVAYDSDHQPVMNEDERRILQIVQAAEGDLPRIYMGIRNSGEIVDDISLLRLEYSTRHETKDETLLQKLWAEHASATEPATRLDVLRKILQADAENMSAWRSLVRLHLRNGNMVDAAFITECMVRIRPERDFLMYSAALLYFRLGNADKALNFADRLTLRNWHVERYLVLLGKIHESRQDELGMREAGLLLQELEPGHDYAAKLLNNPNSR
jgi:hypothetical protein